MSGYARGLIAITGLALAGRLFLLGSVPVISGDEAFTGVIERLPLGGMLDVVRHDNHPPLGYLLTRLVAVFSTSPAALESMLDAALVPALVLLAAAAVRLFDLVSQPGGLYPDEGAE
ncbi:MAG: hypothetical protein QOE92_2243, partial [Chloroflexota bacterium]|nr:hypothetical protein [Chloroflexota bacterium]